MSESADTLRLWGRNNSINVQKVIWTLEELKIPYERIEAGGAHGVVDTPEYLALNPNGLVPVIHDPRGGGLTLWESNAIVRYLFATYAPESGTGLHYPADSRPRAIEEQWMDWQATALWPAMQPMFHGLIRNTPGVTPDMIAAATTLTETRLAVLDQQLDTMAFTAGKRFGMADITTGLTVARWFKLPIDHKRFRHIENWFEAIRTRSAFRHVDIPLS